MILVPLRRARRRRSLRTLPVFGFDDAPHGHVEIDLQERARAR